MNNRIVSFIKIMLFFAFGISILYLVYYRQNIAFQAECSLNNIPSSDCSLIQKLLKDISHINYLWIWITIVIYMISNYLRALRWKMMLEAIGYKPKMMNLFATVMVNYLANLGIPRSGEVVRAALLSKYENIPVEKVFGTVVTDRIFDVIMMMVVFGTTILLGGSAVMGYLDKNINLVNKLSAAVQNPWIIFSLVIFTMVFLWIIYKTKSKIRNTTWGSKFIIKLMDFYSGVKSVRYISNVPMFIFHTVTIWVLYYLMQYLAFFSFAPTEDLGPIAGLVVFAFGSLGIVIPTPGGMGSFHYLTGEALAIYGVQGADSFAYANIVFFSIQIFTNIFFGALAMVILPIINKPKL